MNAEAWREVMTRWNAELIDTLGYIWWVPADIVASGWLGCVR